MVRSTVPVAVLLILLFLAAPAAACISPYGFDDFEPTPLVAPGSSDEVAPVDVSASTVDDMFPKILSYKGDLYAFWIKSTGRTVVTESLMMRSTNGTGWGPLLVVNSPDPDNGTREGELIRIAGFDVAVHEGLLYVVWCTPDPEVTDGKDDDPVYRTFDGTSWGPIVQLVPPDDGGEDVQPAIASTPSGLMVVWTTSSPILSNGTDQDIVVRLVGEDAPDTITELTLPGDRDGDFLPRVTNTPVGTYVVWHTRSLRELPNARGPEYGIIINGRWMASSIWRDLPDITGGTEGEDLWLDMMWDGDRLCLVWQRGGSSFAYSATRIMYRELGMESMSPVQDLTARVGTSYNGRPRLTMVDDEVSVLWHTNDDGLTVGTSYDLVRTVRQEGGHWTTVDAYMADPERGFLQVQTARHAGGVWATWITNVTYEVPTPEGVAQVWDVVVGPIKVGEDPARNIVVTPRWVRSTKAWGPDDRIVFNVERAAQAMPDTLLTVTVVDPSGRVEAVLEGTTDGKGQASFDHVMRTHGDYDLQVAVEGQLLGAMELQVSAPPPGYIDGIRMTLVMVAFALVGMAVVGSAFIRKNGVVDIKAEGLKDAEYRPTAWFWNLVARVLTRIVRSARLQGWLQLPLFILFVATIVLGYVGTQDPQANFATMVGWVYYLPGMLILYAFFGRLWCYVEACGFVDTWAKRLAPKRKWRQWPKWLTGLWLAFILLLAGFWVEVVFSIDLYPWAVSTFMLSILLVNLAVSITFGKRTYCRFVCRDGVVEELIARFSLFKIGVKTREDTVNRGASCIWTEGEKRPGYCSMCFTCVQDNPDVKEAKVTPMLKEYGKDVYKPKAVHRDEAWASLLLMGISIPYMMVLTQAWWIGLTDFAFALEPTTGTGALMAFGALLVALTIIGDRWAFRRWAGWFTTSRRVLFILLQGLLLSLYFLAILGGGVGRLIALRSLIVLGCFTVPFIVMWIGERLVVRLTGNARGEPAGRLMERYGLIFIPMFIGVLIARNLPIVAMWGYAVFDIFHDTLMNFPGGSAEIGPEPFIDPSLFFGLGVAALLVGFALGAYTALQISRRVYKERRHAASAFAVHAGMLGLMVGLFVYILAMPPG